MTTAMARDVVLVVGDVMTDIIVRAEGSLRRGSDRAAEIRSRPGGSGANQAVWLGALGAKVRFAARVGHEDVAALTAYFGQFGIEARLAADAELASGRLVTIVDPDGERSFLTDRGANLALSAEDLDDRMLDGAGMLVVSGYSFFAEGPRRAVRDLMQRARAQGLRVVVDPASVGFLQDVGTGNFLEWTAGADLIFANEDEARVLTGSSDLAEQAQLLGARFSRVVIKRGAAGAAIGGAEGIVLTLPAVRTAMVDSTGAGDAFAAGFITTLLAGGDERACLAAGIAAGAEAVGVVGGQPPAKRRHV
jgi:sugar/nucleoside kinase (ribokinase family)